MNQQLKELTEFMKAHPEMTIIEIPHRLSTIYGKGYIALGFMDSDWDFNDTYYN